MKLWLCHVELDLVVASEEKPDDYTVGRLARDEARDNGFDSSWCSTEITSLNALPSAWKGCYPQSNTSRTKTCDEIIADNEEAARLAREKAPLPGQKPLFADEEPT